MSSVGTSRVMPSHLRARLWVIEGKDVYLGSEKIGELQPEITFWMDEIVDKHYLHVSGMIELDEAYLEGL